MEDTNQVIVYQGSPLERVAASQLVMPETFMMMEQKKLYLASDVIIGKYGIVGMVIVDSRPEKRWYSYTNSDWTGVSMDAEADDPDFLLARHGIESYDSYRKAHFFDTDKGFKMIRYFILPENVREFFKRDSYLGDPLIDKCCREGTLPAEFDEVVVNPSLGFRDEDREVIDMILGQISPSLEKIGQHRFSWEDFGHHLYFSFHPWQHYKPVAQAGEEAVVRAVKNFDSVLRRFDEREVLQKRDLQVDGAIEYKGILPPSQ